SLSLASLAAASANSFLGGLMQIPESVVTSRRGDLRNQMQPNLPSTLAHVYRDLSDEELAGLIKWSESEHGKLFYSAVELAVRDALNASSLTLSRPSQHSGCISSPAGRSASPGIPCAAACLHWQGDAGPWVDRASQGHRTLPAEP